MPLPGAVEARRISAQLEALEQQRAQGILPHENAPLRLYRVPTGGFVRVLDRNPEPISPGMLEAISAFIQKNDKKDDLEETKASPKQESEEKKTLQLQDSAASLVDAAEQDNTQNFTCNTGGNSAANEEIAVALSGTANVDGDGVEMTANSTSVDVEMTAPWGSDGIVKTPKELLGQNERASDWLSKDLAQNRVESRAVPLQEVATSA
ncbi:hypothetical protein PHYBOEH_004832 [Phytophthora boehmeriae]|uniref:Uncharacterized protein n=1 Tax=Phytophthora boehmeriae TaxID=109152 RepID=A0A8T1WMP6_9STRA|nr:hypothetical protein PHYBOEH_004832 [Phytophthora boehmeriae]